MTNQQIADEIRAEVAWDLELSGYGHSFLTGHEYNYLRPGEWFTYDPDGVEHKRLFMLLVADVIESE